MERTIITKRKVIVKPYRRYDGTKVRGYSYFRDRGKKSYKRRKTFRRGMLFCPTCGAMLIPKRIDGQTQLYCPRCKTAIPSKNYQITTLIPHEETERTIVVEGPDETFTTVAYCPKCGKKVRVKTWQAQIRSSDEPSTTFYRCEKGHTWRETI